MEIEQEGVLVRIFIGESDRFAGKPLYEWLVLKAREQGLAGATVFRGMMGFGASSRIHTSKIMRLSEDLPVVIELVDSRKNLDAYMQSVDHAIGDGLATFEKADIHFYRSKNGR